MSGVQIVNLAANAKRSTGMHICGICLSSNPQPWGGGGLTPHMKGVGMVVGNFELNP